MRQIEWTGAFKRDYRRTKANPHHQNLDQLLNQVVSLLVEDKPLPPKLYDHPLSGDWKDHRDCHIKPNLVLIYRKPDAELLQLVRLGSHSELGF
jgi:mRNA interferase YafQ